MSGRHAARDGDPEGASLRVVTGSPTPEELAAVTAVLTALEAETADRARATPRSAPTTLWSAPAARLRRPLERGAGRWRGFSG